MEITVKKVFLGCATLVGGFLGLLVAFVLVLGFAVEGGYIPDSAAQPAGKIHPRYLKELKAMGVVEPEENVLYFYSAALLSLRDDGNLFTDQRVISYQEVDGELEVLSARYEEITDIDFDQSGAWGEESTITVTREDGTWFVLLVGTEGSGDQSFYDRLNQTWESRLGSAGSQPPGPAAAEASESGG